MSEIVAEGTIKKSVFEDYLDIFQTLNHEGRMHWNDEGLVTRIKDPADVAMIAPGVLTTDAFESYDAPGSVTIALDYNKAKDYIGAAGGGQLLDIAVDMETRKLIVDYGSAHQSIGLIDPESLMSEPTRKDLDLPNKLVIDGERAKRAMNIMDITATHFRIQADPEEERVRFLAKGDTDSSHFDFTPENSAEMDLPEESETIFGVDYFKRIVDEIPDDASVQISLRTEYPGLIVWDSADGGFHIEAMIAPRIVSD